MASQSTILNVYQAQLIPMPTEANRASIWDIEAQYIAVTENRQYAALLSDTELRACVGSRTYGICENGFSLQKIRIPVWRPCCYTMNMRQCRIVALKRSTYLRKKPQET